MTINLVGKPDYIPYSQNITEPGEKVKKVSQKSESLDDAIIKMTTDRVDIKVKKGIPSTAQDYNNVSTWLTQTTGKESAYKTPEQIKAYTESLKGHPQSAYDKNGFLKENLGLENLKTPGRTIKEFRQAINSTDFKPDNSFIQKPFFWLLQKHPDAYEKVSGFANFFSELPNQITKKWEKSFTTAFKPSSDITFISPDQWYKDVQIKSKDKSLEQILQDKNLTFQEVNAFFGGDFHYGNPDENGQNYGTHGIARHLGFTDAQAKRIAQGSLDIDANTAIYKRTNPSPFGALDRHFNLNRKDIGTKEDTRLIWAKNHLEEAIQLAQKGAYIEAEKALGYGLHGLQDLFAHAQLRSTDHAVIGKFPDKVEYNPYALLEATAATMAYLKTYIKAIM